MVSLIPDLAVALDLQLHRLRKGVDHRDADAVESARDLVGVLVELTPGMELGHDDLGRRPAFLAVEVHRDAAAVVLHRHRVVGVDDDVDARAVAGLRLVHRVVDDLEDHVVEPGRVVGVPDVHARALAHRLQALQYLDILSRIGRLWVHQNRISILSLGACFKTPREGGGPRMCELYHEKGVFCEPTSAEISMA